VYTLLIFTGLLLVLSLSANREKTVRALRIALRGFLNLLPSFLTMMCLVALFLAFLPREIIVRYLGVENLFLGTGLATILGSVSLMPGFIAFPLGGILLEEGVPYVVLAAFTTTLMMVGVATFPVERHFLGTKVALLRNGISLLIALAISLAIGFWFGELL
jgi:uncharacterized membrane protein YraQ (UPF0718 family)